MVVVGKEVRNQVAAQRSGTRRDSEATLVTQRERSGLRATLMLSRCIGHLSAVNYTAGNQHLLAVTSSYEDIKSDDVERIPRGRFHLLFSADCPLGPTR